jgi:hypothetical protein
MSEANGKSTLYSVVSWSVDDLIGALAEEPIGEYTVRVPNFQRNLVWSNSQKKGFIRTLKDGFPFGALLLAFDKVSKEYLLLDGLQRTSAIKEHRNDPNSSFDRSEIDEILEKKLCEILFLEENEENKEKIQDNIVKWIREKRGFSKSTDGYTGFDLGNKLVEEFESDEIPSDYRKVIVELQSTLNDFLEKVQDDADISRIEIPIILYTGPTKHLPIIFEKLNSKGSKLTKYQIYAAAWESTEIKIKNDEIIKNIQAKYQSLIDEGFRIKDYDEDEFSQTSKNVFEYIFGLGKLITDKYPNFFNEKDDSIADSIGFNLSAVCLGLEINEMADLPSKIQKINLSLFEKALIASLDFVFHNLKLYITLNVNRRLYKEVIRIYHTEYQIVSIVGKVFTLMYDNSFNVRDTWKEHEKKLKISLPQHYLFDIIKDVWRGSGDSRIIEMLDSDIYLNTIPKSRWETALDDWFLSVHLAKKETTRVSIKHLDYLFLNYIYANTLNYRDVLSVRFDIEHLIPVNRLKKIAGDGIPINAISNLCFLPRDINDSKKDDTIYEFYEKKVADKEITLKESKEKINELEKFTWTKEADLEFIKKLDPKSYLDFLMDRFDRIKEHFYEANSIEDKEGE